MLNRGTLNGGFATHAPHKSHPRCLPVVASMGGRPGFGDSSMILGPNGNPMNRPGAPGGPPNRLIIPGGPGQFSQQQRPRAPVGLPLDEPASGPGQLPPAHKYRPPAGFMGDNVQDPSLNMSDPQELISKLRSRAGQWHQLAKLLPVLYSKGLDSNTISELTGINPNEQNDWIVAGTVYDSIVGTGKVDASVLGWFDSDGYDKLSPFRFLPAERRAAAAQYIMENDLDAPGCEVLARAMKEWDRRRGERTGFDNSPGDCMAFKYLRDAVECRNAEEAGEKLALAFAAAVTDSARERLADWRDTELAERTGGPAGGPATSLRARLTVLRLQNDELGFRPLAQISPLSQATVDELQWAPRTSQEGAFGAFELQAGGQPGQKWVALPQWKALALARHPVAIPLPDCAADPAVLAASRAKTEEEKKKLTGVGLLVVDTESSSSSIDPDTYYVVAAPPGSSQQLQLKDGTQLINSNGSSSEVVATVLFLCRPPNRESQITSSELLQL